MVLASDSAGGDLAKDDVLLDVERLRSSATAYAGGTDLRQPELSPVYADCSSLPPTHIEVGTGELLLSDSTRLAARADAAGVDVTSHVLEDLLHVFQIFSGAPEAQESSNRIDDFPGRHLD